MKPIAVVCAAILALAVSGCSKDENENMLDKASKKMEKASDDAKDAIDDAADKAKDAMEDE